MSYNCIVKTKENIEPFRGKQYQRTNKSNKVDEKLRKTDGALFMKSSSPGDYL